MESTSTNASNEAYAQSTSVYEEYAWAYNTVMNESNIGNSWLWDTHSAAISTLQGLRPFNYEPGVISTLPKAPKGFKKEDRTLEIAMKTIYRVIAHKSVTLRIFTSPSRIADLRGVEQSY